MLRLAESVALELITSGKLVYKHAIWRSKTIDDPNLNTIEKIYKVVHLGTKLFDQWGI